MIFRSDLQQPHGQHEEHEEEQPEPPTVIAVNDSIVLNPSVESNESGQGENAQEVDQPVQGQDNL